MKQMLDCIVCPASCHIQVETGADGELQISGNGCKRGAAYAKTELTAPGPHGDQYSGSFRGRNCPAAGGDLGADPEGSDLSGYEGDP